MRRRQFGGLLPPWEYAFDDKTIGQGSRSAFSWILWPSSWRISAAVSLGSHLVCEPRDWTSTDSRNEISCWIGQRLDYPRALPYTPGWCKANCNVRIDKGAAKKSWKEDQNQTLQQRMDTPWLPRKRGVEFWEKDWQCRGGNGGKITTNGEASLKWLQNLI